MNGFYKFYEDKVNDEAEESLKKLPEKHRHLIKGYKFKFEDGCNLKGYPDSIGLIHLGNPDKKIIQVAAPWRYGREFAFLHEVAHLIFDKLCKSKWKTEWEKTVKLHKKRQKQNNEELWCMAYANHFAQHKNMTHTHSAWESYMTDFCKETG